MAVVKDLNPEEQSHKLYADAQEVKKDYIAANDAYTLNPSEENKTKLDEAQKKYEASLALHTEHKTSEEYQNHVSGVGSDVPAGFKKLYVKDDFSNSYKPVLVKADAIVDGEKEETQEEVNDALSTKSPEEMNAKELKAALDLKGITYAGNASKATLLALLVEATSGATNQNGEQGDQGQAGVSQEPVQA